MPKQVTVAGDNRYCQARLAAAKYNPELSNRRTAVSYLPGVSEDSLKKYELAQLKVVVDQRTSAAMELECTEDNKKDIKDIRAELNKEKALIVERYKMALDEVVAPIKAVETKFKSCIEGYKKADEDLKKKIADIEDAQKEAKRVAVETYFNEYAQSKGIDFIEFENLDIKVNLSTTETALKKQVATFLERVATDLKMISTQEDEEEILVEYKKTLNASDAITTVKERKKRIQAGQKIL